MTPRRLSVVLFNLGGPDRLEAVEPFLFNLFNDRAIIGLPQPFRAMTAKLISRIRAKTAQEIYGKIGGGSPLLTETEAQRARLALALAERFPMDAIQTVVAMRHWKPLTKATAKAVSDHRPEEIVLLPLYPQYSTTTTGSSLAAWRRAYRGKGRIHAVCCYPDRLGLIEAHAAKIVQMTPPGEALSSFRIVFSAHGLPEKLILGGDPYQAQVERSVAAVVARLGLTDWRTCYQSRVGPLKWIGPSIHDVILEAGCDEVGLIVVPIAFVSEHSETLVELDMDYRALAEDAGVPIYLRAPAIGVDPHYIEAMADMVAQALDSGEIAPQGGACQGRFAQCPYQNHGLAQDPSQNQVRAA